MNRVVWITVLVFVAVLGLALIRVPIFAQAANAPTAEKQASPDKDSAEQGSDLPFAQRLKIKMLNALKSGATFWALLIAFLAGILANLRIRLSIFSNLFSKAVYRFCRLPANNF